MEKLKKTYSNHPVSLILVALAVVLMVTGPIVGSSALQLAAIGAISGAVVFGGIFDL